MASTLGGVREQLRVVTEAKEFRERQLCGARLEVANLLQKLVDANRRADQFEAGIAKYQKALQEERAARKSPYGW